MTRRRIRSPLSLNFDPLMDVVTNAVGIMLFVVIFAVIEARSTTVTRFTPLLSKPKAHQDRIFYLCSEGRLRRFDWDGVVETVAGMAKGLTYSTVPKLVTSFNKKDIRDAHFSYRLEQRDEEGFETTRKIFLVAYALNSRTSLEQDLRTFEAELNALDDDRDWLSFLVSDSSIETFLDARELAAARGFAVGWDPATIEFPLRQCILGCGTGSGQDGLGTGPQSGGVSR